jgi:hypothetical protein
MHAQQQASKRHRAAKYHGWAVDLETLQSIDSISLKDYRVVWNADEEIRREGRWAYADRSNVDVQRTNGEMVHLNVRRRIENETITGYILTATSGKSKTVLWEYSPHTGGHGESMRCLVWGDSLFVVVYSPIATGSSLVCVNLSTGKGIWEGDVKQLMVSHSKYRNEVYLHRLGNYIALAGDEASGGYLQLIDVRTGKNMFSRLSGD